MKKRLNANHLKMIAIIAMTLDHAADLIYPGFPSNPIAIILHTIGRLTAPIMWFFVCEGFHHTRNLRKYLCRMFVFPSFRTLLIVLLLVLAFYLFLADSLIKLASFGLCSGQLFLFGW